MQTGCAPHSPIRLFDAATLEELWVATGHTQVVRTMKFAPHRRRLYSAGDDRVIRVWDIANRKLSLELSGPELPISGFAMSPDERTLAVSDQSGELRLWHLRTGRELFELSSKTVSHRLEFSADGLELTGVDTGMAERRWSCRE